MRTFGLISIFAIHLALAPMAGAEPMRFPHVRAELLADVNAVEPGRPFRVGVRLELDPHWHVYWTNPGETGQPTQVTFSMPAGFSAGPVEYTVPKTFTLPGDIVGYGYEDEVLLMANVTPSPHLDAATPLTIKADVSWLVCADVCIPGRAALQLTLPVGAATPADGRALFDKSAAAVPVKVEASEDVQGVTHQAIGDRHRITITWKRPGTRVEWFPPPAQSVYFNDIKVLHGDPNTTLIEFVVETLAGQAPPEGDLGSVVAYTDASEQRRGVVTPIDLSAKPGPQAFPDIGAGVRVDPAK